MRHLGVQCLVLGSADDQKRFYTRLGFEHVQTLQTVNELGEDAFEYVMCMSPCKSAAVGEKSA
jgi:hypothetical protein